MKVQGRDVNLQNTNDQQIQVRKTPPGSPTKKKTDSFIAYFQEIYGCYENRLEDRSEATFQQTQIIANAKKEHLNKRIMVLRMQQCMKITLVAFFLMTATGLLFKFNEKL